jgi:ribonuclease BN (tRNA processing enzyme)
MGTKITFLGTAGDTSSMGKQILHSGGIVIEDETLQMHIDPGPGALVRLKQHNINIRNTDILLVSKSDILHAGDINAVSEGMTIGGFDRKGVLLCCHSLVGESETETPLLAKQVRDHLERIIALRIGDKVGLGNMNVFPTKTTSTDEKCIGFKIVAPRYCLGYTGVTGYTKEIAGQYKGCDILIHNIAFTGDEQKDIDAANQLVSEAKPRVVILTGFSSKMVRTGPLNIVREVHRETGVQAIAAKEGLTINPLSYASKVRQKSLQPM